MRNSTDYASAYLRLRTILDSLESNTMSYCFDSKDAEERVNRMQTVEAELMHVIDTIGAAGTCRPGYYNCGGICVPYQCAEEPTIESAMASDPAP